MTPRLPLPRSLPGRAPLRVSARFVSSHAGTESRPSPARAALSLPLPGIALSEERCRAALMGAVTADDFALLRLTLAKMTGCGTNPDFRSMRGFSETPLALAVRLGRSLMIPALLRAGADIRQRTGKNSEPLLSAALRAGKENAALELLACGAPADSADRDGITPLHWAAAGAGLSAAEALIRAGASPDAREKHGLTPLHIAAYRDRPDMCRLLIECGASLSARTAGGLTPADCGVRAGACRAVCFLLQPANGGPGPGVPPAPLSPRMRGLLKSRASGQLSP